MNYHIKFLDDKLESHINNKLMHTNLIALNNYYCDNNYYKFILK